MVWFQLNRQQMDAVLELERSGSERIVAVVGAALLDQSLSVALEWRMRADEDTVRKVFKTGGPLEGASKVDLGYLLYMYDKEARDAFTAIYTIRNYFAHNLDMRFDTKKYTKAADALKKLTLHTNREMYPDPLVEGDSDHPIGPINTKQEKFLANLKIGLIWLGKDHHAHLPWQNTPSNVTFSRPATPSA